MKDEQRKAMFAKGFKVKFKSKLTHDKFITNSNTFKSLSSAKRTANTMINQHYPKTSGGGLVYTTVKIVDAKSNQLLWEKKNH